MMVRATSPPDERVQVDATLFEALFHALPDPAIYVNSEGHVQIANRAFEKEFGWKASDVVGRPIHALFAQNVPLPATDAPFNWTYRRAGSDTCTGLTSMSAVYADGRARGHLYYIRTVSDEPQARPTDTGRRILLVEDNVVNQRIACAMLTRLGHTCMVVGDGTSAIKALDDHRFDVVLMDCQLPNIDGFETTRRIRELTGDRSRVPIIALTANAMKGDRERCLKAGMNDYLAKPLRPALLQEMLDLWMPATSVPDAPPLERAVTCK